jgi:hypothetical protein
MEMLSLGGSAGPLQAALDFLLDLMDHCRGCARTTAHAVIKVICYATSAVGCDVFQLGTRVCGVFVVGRGIITRSNGVVPRVACLSYLCDPQDATPGGGHSSSHRYASSTPVCSCTCRSTYCLSPST